MKILITGNMGYVGPVLAAHLRKVYPEAYLVGYDTSFFGSCLNQKQQLPEGRLNAQFFGDIRHIPDSLLGGIDAIVHLAAISNDPMGVRFEGVTHEVNHTASANLARRAFECGVKRFVFASSCSIYGFAEGGPRTETNDLNPLTAYAKSKVAMEQELAKLAASFPNAIITALRFATACGLSDRLRLDLVLNDFVASALSKNEITVLSDGSPWRPLIHVKDMARAVEWALVREAQVGSNYLAINAGSNEWNYQVKDLAQAVAAAIPGTKVSINPAAVPDKRSYRVNFDLFKKMAPLHQPIVTLAEAVEELKKGMEMMAFKDTEFRSSHFMRLKVLEEHISQGRLTEQLYWT
jgi:nucleoside-diphosphate-sugar epimerase